MTDRERITELRAAITRVLQFLREHGEKVTGDVAWGAGNSETAELYQYLHEVRRSTTRPKKESKPSPRPLPSDGRGSGRAAS